MKLRAFAAAGIAVFVLALIGCGGSSNPVAATPVTGGGGGGTGANVTITITGQNGAQSFSPNPGSLAAGQTVAWFNADSVSHTATADGGGFDTGVIAPGATSSPITMSAAGSLAYHCAIHPSMVGSLTVTQ